MNVTPSRRRGLRHVAFAGLTVALVAGSGVAFAVGAVAAPATGTAFYTADLDPDVAKNLQYHREEERMTRDLYAALAEVHDDAAPMSRIVNAEQRHYDAVGLALTRYGIEDPSANATAGTYAYPELTDAYTTWLAQGSASLADAYQVGIAVEQTDIADLQEASAGVTQFDLVRLYSNLQRGSERHLTAFQAAANGQPVGMRDGAGPQNRPDWAGQGADPQHGARMHNGMGMQNGAGMRNGMGMQRGFGDGTGTRPMDGTGQQRGAGPGASHDGTCPFAS